MKRLIALIILACTLLSFGKLPIEAALAVSKNDKLVVSSVEQFSKLPKFNPLQLAEFDNEAEDDLQAFSEFVILPISFVPFTRFAAFQIRVQQQYTSNYLGWKAPPAQPFFVVFCNYRL